MAGVLAGTLDSHGYVQISINRKSYLAHRLAWQYVNGIWPIGRLDHINNIRNDNRIINLREATALSNSWNVARKRTNTSGYKGVSFRRETSKWRSRIMVNGSRKHLGEFDSPEAAHAAYCDAAKDFYGEFYNPG
jgi:hypothetical protein